MISVSARAADVLEDMLVTHAAPEDNAVRLVLEGPDRLAVTIEQPQESDEVIVSGGRPVLYVEEAVAERVDEALLDVTDTDDGPRLAIRRVTPDE